MDVWGRGEGQSAGRYELQKGGCDQIFSIRIVKIFESRLLKFFLSSEFFLLNFIDLLSFLDKYEFR